jgi:hypothetical protein
MIHREMHSPSAEKRCWHRPQVRTLQLVDTAGSGNCTTTGSGSERCSQKAGGGPERFENGIWRGFGTIGPS